MDFKWPEPPFEVVLVEPDIPPNTGNIGRLCAATQTPLHLVEPLGFRLTDASVRRAGLDYWAHVPLTRHPSFAACQEALSDRRHWYFSTKGRRLYTDIRYQPGDVLVFGSETRGLPEDLLEAQAEQVLTLPMQCTAVRSLNLANVVSVVLYEALRQYTKRRRKQEG
jgi:tRNA (cytidine/uridine-2'-O-)-methyltransferase